MAVPRLLLTTLLSAGLLVAALPARAEPAQSAALIQEIIQNAGLSEITRDTEANLVRGVSATIRAQDPKADPKVFEVLRQVAKKHFAGYEQDANAFSTARLSQHFSHDELQTIAAFYRTPAGKKSVPVMRQIVGQTLNWSRNWVQKAIPAMQQDFDDRLTAAGLKPKPPGAPAANPSPTDKPPGKKPGKKPAAREPAAKEPGVKEPGAKEPGAK